MKKYSRRDEINKIIGEFQMNVVSFEVFSALRGSDLDWLRQALTRFGQKERNEVRRQRIAELQKQIAEQQRQKRVVD